MPTIDESGRIRRSNVSDGEKNDILSALAKPGASIQSVAKEFGRDISTVQRLVASLKPTTALARATLLARANEMVERVIEKADVDQLIDVLSRPNIGVLDPATKGGSGGMGVGIHVSINTGSLAAVNDTYDPNYAQPQVAESSIDGKVVKVGSTVLGERNSSTPDARNS